MNIPVSLIIYFSLFEVLVWNAHALFRPSQEVSALIRRICFHMACAVCAISHTILEYYVLKLFTYHIIALSLLGFCILLIAIFFRHFFLYGLFLSMQMSILYPITVFLSTNLGNVLGLARLPFTVLQVCATVLLLTACFSWIRHSAKNVSFTMALPGSYYIVMYLFSLIEYYCVIKLNDLITLNGLLSIVNLLLQAGILILYLIVISFIFSMCSGYQTALKDQAIRQQMELMQKNLEENKNMYTQMRTLRHELKNHMFYMDYLIDQKDYDTLHQYFSEFYQKEYQDYNYWDTSSTLVGTLLNQKMQLAKVKNIDMNITASLPEKTGIADIDLCAVLSNLLDNAIESCSGQLNPSIEVSISVKKQYLSIRIANTVPENVLEKNPSLSTTKKDPGVHGIGLRVVRQIVKKYNGMQEISVESGRFIVKILMEMQEEELSS